MRSARRRGGLLASALLLGALAIAPGARAAGLADSPWPMFQQNPHHTGQSPHAGPSIFALQWRARVNAAPGSPAIGTDGTIYLPTGSVNNESGSGSLYAINPDGSVRWRFQFPLLGICHQIAAGTAPAIADDGTIYVHTQAGRTPEGDFCTAGDSYLFAVNPNGTKKWHFQFNLGGAVLKSAALSSPAIGGDGTIYVGSFDTALYAITPSGNEDWVVSPDKTSIGSSPEIGADGTIYFTTFDLHAYEPDGDFKWTAELGDGCCIHSSPSVATDGTIYACGINPANCHAVSPAGNVLWSFPIDAGATTPAISTAGTIYFPTGPGAADSGRVTAVNPNGTELWNRDLSNSFGSAYTPVLGSNGLIYALVDEGLLGSGQFGDVLFALNSNGSDSGRREIPGEGGNPGGELNMAIGAGGTLYVPEPNDAFSDSYDPNNQFLAAYVQGSPEPPDDVKRPGLRLGGKRIQDLVAQKGVVVEARCPTEDCTATATGRVFGASTYRLKRAKKEIPEGKKRKLKLRARRPALRAIKDALEDNKKVRARVIVTVEDAAGNERKKRRRIKIK